MKQLLRKTAKKLTGALLLVLWLPSCGNRQGEDLKAQKELKAQTSPTKDAPLVVVGGGANADAVARVSGCQGELSRSTLFDPTGGSQKLTVVFAADFSPECRSRGNPTLFLASEGTLELPAVTCEAQDGDFQLKCSGDLLTVSDTGRVELRLDGSEGSEALKSLRVQVSFE